MKNSESEVSFQLESSDGDDDKESVVFEAGETGFYSSIYSDHKDDENRHHGILETAWPRSYRYSIHLYNIGCLWFSICTCFLVSTTSFFIPNVNLFLCKSQDIVCFDKSTTSHETAVLYSLYGCLLVCNFAFVFSSVKNLWFSFPNINFSICKNLFCLSLQVLILRVETVLHTSVWLFVSLYLCFLVAKNLLFRTDCELFSFAEPLKSLEIETVLHSFSSCYFCTD